MLKLIAYFTYRATLLFLYFLEISEQTVSLLEKYFVKYRHVVVQDPGSTLKRGILFLMCIDAGAGIQMQCGHEHRLP